MQGACRQNRTEFINEDDMEELFQKLDDGEVHHVGEVSLLPWPPPAQFLLLFRDPDLF
jgi:hypothetical protein